MTTLNLFAFLAQGQETIAEKDSFYNLSPVEVKAVRAAEHAPVQMLTPFRLRLNCTDHGWWALSHPGSRTWFVRTLSSRPPKSQDDMAK